MRRYTKDGDGTFDFDEFLNLFKVRARLPRHHQGLSATSLTGLACHVINKACLPVISHGTHYRFLSNVPEYDVASIVRPGPYDEKTLADGVVIAKFEVGLRTQRSPRHAAHSVLVLDTSSTT